MLEVLVFSKIYNNSARRFVREISNLPGITPIYSQEYKRFTHILVNHTIDRIPVLFLVQDGEDLDFAVTVKRYLVQTQLIMVLPDKRSDIVSRALSLSPCLIAFSGSEAENVVSILEKMATLKVKKTSL